MSYNPYLTEENFFVATKACLVYDSKILILEEQRPGKPLWLDLPGGKISKEDKDYSLYQSLGREVQEELGIDIILDECNTKLFMAYKSYEDVTFSDSLVPFIFLCYLYEFDTFPDIVLSHEHASFRWIGSDDVGLLSGWRPGFDDIVRKAFTHFIHPSNP